MIGVRENNDVYEIRSRYDPEFINIVKSIAGRRWIPERKIWTIPKDKLGFLIAAVRDTEFADQLAIQSSEDLDVNATLDKTASVPNIDLTGIPLYVEAGGSLYAHQKDTLRFAISRDNIGLHSGFLLADEPGLGKTLSVINLALYRKLKNNAKHCLIICCINTSKFNWYDDIIKHTNGEYQPYILGSRKRRSGGFRVGEGKEKLADLKTMTAYGTEEPLPFFIIINIEALRYKQKREYLIAKRISELINSGEISIIAVDEIHKYCSPTSQQGKQLLEIKKSTGSSAEWIPMTGTPIVNSPLDCFLPLRLIDVHNYSSFYLWCQHFCIYGGYNDKDIIGYKNIPQLKMMVQNNMLRRLKSEVLDLPEKIRTTEYVENTAYQKKLYNEVLSELRNRRSEISSSMNPLANFLKLRQVNGYPEAVDNHCNPESADYIQKNAKLQRLLELVEFYCGSGQKIVIFSNWVEPLRMIYRYVSKMYKTCCYTGTMKTEDRNQHKRVFQTNPEYKILLGTIGALGTTHTLTASHVIIFYDEPWNCSDKTQAEDRCHRISMTEPLMIHTIITEGTVDEVVNRIQSKKGNMAKFIVDNDLDVHAHPELLDVLLA